MFNTFNSNKKKNIMNINQDKEEKMDELKCMNLFS